MCVNQPGTLQGLILRDASIRHGAACLQLLPHCQGVSALGG